MKIDLGVMAADSAQIESFCKLGYSLKLSGFAAPENYEEAVKNVGQMMVYSRVDIKGRTIASIKKQIDRVRKTTVIIALEIGSIDRTNWAVDDKRVDLLTMSPASGHPLRATTARLAAAAGIALEIQIAPLLGTSGLNRSKILKTYRVAMETAYDNGMMIVITSGAKMPMGLRAPVAMVHIGMLLGLEKTYAQKTIDDFPTIIVQRNLKKLDSNYVGAGVEIIRGSENR